MLRRVGAGRRWVEFAQSRLEFFYSGLETTLFGNLRLEGFEISVVSGSANKAEERGSWGQGTALEGRTITYPRGRVLLLVRSVVLQRTLAVSHGLHDGSLPSH